MIADGGGGEGDDGGGVGGDGEEPARSQTRTESMTKCVCTRGWTEIIWAVSAQTQKDLRSLHVTGLEKPFNHSESCVQHWGQRDNYHGYLHCCGVEGRIYA